MHRLRVLWVLFALFAPADALAACTGAGSLADCRGARLAGQTIEDVRTPAVDLREAILQDARLTHLDIRRADIRGAVFARARLTDVRMDRVRASGATVFAQAVLRRSRLGGNLRRVHFEGADLRGADLRGADLRGADLSATDLRGADLRDVRLAGAKLRAARLDRADLRGAELEDADLSGASARGARLRGARIDRAVLRGTRLHGADLRGARLRGVDLTYANLTGARLGEYGRRLPGLPGAPRLLDITAHTCGTQVAVPDRSATAGPQGRPTHTLLEREHGAWLARRPDVPRTDARFLARSRPVSNREGLDCRPHGNPVARAATCYPGPGPDCAWWVLDDLSFADIDVSHGDFFDTQFVDTSLVSMNFSGSFLAGANFTGATVDGSDFSGATPGLQPTTPTATIFDLANSHDVPATFAGGNFRAAQFSGASLTGANFSGAELQNANFDAANLQGADFTGADLTGAQMDNANLQQAVFTNANLSSANLNYADAAGATFGGATLDGTQLMYTDLTGGSLAGAGMRGANLTGTILVDTALGIFGQPVTALGDNFSYAEQYFPTVMDLSGYTCHTQLTAAHGLRAASFGDTWPPQDVGTFNDNDCNLTITFLGDALNIIAGGFDPLALEYTIAGVIKALVKTIVEAGLKEIPEEDISHALHVLFPQYPE